MAGMSTARRVAECTIETKRLVDVRGFVLDRLQAAGECDGFDGGNARLCHARLAVLPLFSPGEIRAGSLTESLLNQSYTLFTPSS
jgi:hypothetical protein